MFKQIKQFQKEAQELDRDLNSVEEFKLYLQAKVIDEDQIEEIFRKDLVPGDQVVLGMNFIRTVKEIKPSKTRGYIVVEYTDGESGSGHSDDPVKIVKGSGEGFEARIASIILAQKLEKFIADLVPSEPSATKVSYEDTFQKLEAGETIQPIKVALVDNEYVVTDGNSRAKALKDFGITNPVVELITLSPNRQDFFRKKMLIELKGFGNLPVDEDYKKRQERYSSINFIHCSKQYIEKIRPERNSVLISIAGVSDNFAKVSSNLYKDILQLRFSDVQRDLGKFIAFRSYQAQSILNFINSNLPLQNVYINCEQGISRSAGVRQALERIYNQQDMFLPKANKHVKDILLREKYA